MATIINKCYTIDPVCNIKVTQSGKVQPFTYQADTYYFCAEACRDQFIADPAKYLQAKSAQKKGLWARYLERLNKATGGKTPPCCH